MRWEKLRSSENVENRRGQAGRGGGPVKMGGGLGLVLLVVAALIFGVNPLELLSQSGASSPFGQQSQSGAVAANPEMDLYLRKVVGSTEDEWTAIFRASGLAYRPARVVSYAGSTPMRSGGLAQAATGPFYLPAEETVYLDYDFFQELRRLAKDRTGSDEYDFAPAYVIAHEIGHHVQNLLGYSDRVHAQRGRVSKAQYNQLSVRLELQADYFAGVWAHHADARLQASDGVSLLEKGDIDEAMRAAKSIGDDALQRAATGVVQPDSFTHGTSAQRLRWFTKGFQSGDANGGNTFAVSYDQL